MVSKSVIDVAMNKAKEIQQSIYFGRCDVINYVEYTKPNYTTGHKEEITLSDVPCRLSYSKKTKASNDGLTNEVVQEIVLFTAPNVFIEPGSKIVVTQDGYTKEYQRSGEIAHYPTHNETRLELFEGWT